MTERVFCPKCRKPGLTRVERVITGTQMLLSYYCGGCEHTWEMSDAGPTLRAPHLDSARGRFLDSARGGPRAAKRRPR